MKLSVITLFVFLLVTPLAAQDAERNDEPENQLSINATLFIKQFLAFNSTTLATNNPYLIAYKHIKNGKGLRTGVGFDFTDSKVNPNSGTTSVFTRAMSVNTRIGYEWQKNLSKHWGIYYGMDVKYNYVLSRIKTTSMSPGFPPEQIEITTENENFGFGAGPVLGIEFKLGKNISFNAETSCYYTYSELRHREINPQFATFNVNQFTARNSIDLVVPTSLFFVLKF